MANIYNKNDAGVPANTSKNPNGTSSVTFEADQQSLVNATNAQLPANKDGQQPGTINFFGSSYSGADIKLVAHLYRDFKSGDRRRAALETDINRTQQILEGYQLVLGAIDQVSALPTGGPLGTANAQRIGLTGALAPLTDPEARRIVLNSINTAQLRILPSATRIDVQGFINTYNQLLQSQQEQLRSLDQVEYQGFDTIVLGTLQTISIQSHREKYAVRALGHAYAKNYTRGPRTIAGSMIFTVFHEHAFTHMLYAMGNSSSFGDIDPEIASLIPDQLPPIDFTLVFANEYGQISEQRLYGVEFVNDSVNYSIEDIFSEQVINFIARDVDVLTARGRVSLQRLNRNNNNSALLEDLNATELLFNNKQYESYLDRLSLRRRLRNR